MVSRICSIPVDLRDAHIHRSHPQMVTSKRCLKDIYELLDIAQLQIHFVMLVRDNLLSRNSILVYRAFKSRMQFGRQRRAR